MGAERIEGTGTLPLLPAEHRSATAVQILKIARELPDAQVLVLAGRRDEPGALLGLPEREVAGLPAVGAKDAHKPERSCRITCCSDSKLSLAVRRIICMHPEHIFPRCGRTENARPLANRKACIGKSRGIEDDATIVP